MRKHKGKKKIFISSVDEFIKVYLPNRYKEQTNDKLSPVEAITKVITKNSKEILRLKLK